MGDTVRIGRISTIDYKAGTASVTYTDRGNGVSPQFPFFSMCYEMPKVDETAVVIMLSNSRTKGFIVGIPYSEGKAPPESGQGVFCKEFSDGTKIRYDPNGRTLSVDAEKITLESITADSVIVKGRLKAKSIEAEKAEIGDLAVTGTATGHFPAWQEGEGWQ